ncbi:DinB family protein [Pseudobacillus sp. FSL P4-0506]|uniref:DinB family protein n=1 Tax=Pseudobacillus sp. FSL P4-0506 TaxID=2921576 RepID=UPI0030FB7CC7
MQQVIESINHWLIKVPEVFSHFSEAEAARRPMPNKWSKKEILGHLCDSAINNLGKFISIQYEKQPFRLTPYNQNQWVELQDYQHITSEEIVHLWCSLNKKIIKVIDRIPDEKLAYQCDIGNNELKTLEWLIQDYLEHMEHHLKNQIFN